MAANAKTLAHSQTIITELIKTIIRTVELPLEVAKLEGDAVFFFCRKGQGSKPWSQAKREVGGKLLEFFRMFSERLRELSESTMCNCNACTHIFWNLWFAPFAPPRRHASAMSGVGKAARMSFAGLTALLTPIFLHLGLVFVFIHALKPRTGERPRIDDHEHRSDGSCCRGV